MEKCYCKVLLWSPHIFLVSLEIRICIKYFINICKNIGVNSSSHNKAICQWKTGHRYFSGWKRKRWSAPCTLHRIHCQKLAFYSECENIKYNFLFISLYEQKSVLTNSEPEMTEKRWTERRGELLTSFIVSEDHKYDFFIQRALFPYIEYSLLWNHK